MVNEIIIDGENAVLGRLASYAAKQALQGNQVKIVNSEKVVIVGKEKDIFQDFKTRRAKGGYIQRGPFFPSSPDRILKRTIRGMLPYTQDRGRQALKRVLCYIGVPSELEKAKKIKAKGKPGIVLSEVSRRLK